MQMYSARRMTLRWAQISPPLRGRIDSPAGVVAVLAQATSLHGALLLSSGAIDAMTMLPNGQDKL